MKVLVIPTWYPNGEDKLMGIYHKEFTASLCKHGVDADMLYVDRQRLKHPLKYLFGKKIFVQEENGYRTYIIRMLNLTPISYHLNMFFYTRKLAKLFKFYLKDNVRPDVLHAHVTVPAGYATVKLGEKFDIPVVVTEHGGLLERFFKEGQYKKYGLYVLKHSYYTTVSSYMRDIVLKYTKKCDILSNQVDVHLFKNDVVRKKGKTFNLLSVCALREGKRLDIAFEALAILLSRDYGIHYDIIGEGFYEEIFKEAAKTCGVDNYVTFHGRRTKEEIAEFMKSAHALLISSEIESFAISGIEALASGMPVISTDCMGPRDFMDEHTGVMTKVNDPESLAEGIAHLIDNYEDYDKEYLEEVAEKFSEDAVVAHAVEIYERISRK